MCDIMTRAYRFMLAAAAFSFLSIGAFAQQTTTAPKSDTGSGTVATGSTAANPEANPKVKGDRSTIRGDKKATAEQKSGQE
jgi:hypothetical protein